MIPTERIEIEGLRELFALEQEGVALHELNGAICTAAAGAPDSRILNRAIGLGLDSPLTEERVDEAAAFFGELGVGWFVSLAPDAGADAARLLERRGFEPDYAWAKSRRIARDRWKDFKDRMDASVGSRRALPVETRHSRELSSLINSVLMARRARISPVGTSVERARSGRARRSPAYRREQQRLAPYEELARIVIRHRMALGITQKELAERMGTSYSAISRIESGQHKTKPDTLRRLADALGLRFVMGFESGPTDRPVRELVTA